MMDNNQTEHTGEIRLRPATTEVILERDPADKDKPTRKFDRWNAYLGNDLLVEASRDPEHDACRQLQANGITGKLAFRHRDAAHPSTFMDIEKAAGLAVSGDDLRVRKWTPFSDRRGQARSAVQSSDRSEGPEIVQRRCVTKRGGGN